MKIEKLIKRGLDQIVAMAETGNENKYSTNICHMQIEDQKFELSLEFKKVQDVKKDPQQSPDFIQACFNDHFVDAIKSSFFPGNQCETAKDLKADVAKPTNSKFQKKMEEMMEKAKKEKSPLQIVIERRMDQEKSATKNDDHSSVFGVNQAMKDAIDSLHHWKPNGSGKHPNESVDDYQKSIADAAELLEKKREENAKELAAIRKKDFVKKPPIGIIPQWLFLERRLEAIHEAKKRYQVQNAEFPKEWLKEEIEILSWMGSRKDPEPKQPANFATEHRNFINALIQGMKDEMIKNIDVQLEDVSKEMAQEKQLDQEKERSGLMFTISGNPGIKFPYGFHTDLFFQEMERRKK